MAVDNSGLWDLINAWEAARRALILQQSSNIDADIEKLAKEKAEKLIALDLDPDHLRKKMIAALIESRFNDIVKWVQHKNYDLVLSYVSESENLDVLDDDTLKNMYDEVFG